MANPDPQWAWLLRGLIVVGLVAGVAATQSRAGEGAGVAGGPLAGIQPRQSGGGHRYRATRAWDEGKAVYPGSCDGSGADWREARAGLAWSAAGGDFDAGTKWAYVPGTSHSSTGGSNAFTVTGLVAVDADPVR